MNLLTENDKDKIIEEENEEKVRKWTEQCEVHLQCREA